MLRQKIMKNLSSKTNIDTKPHPHFEDSSSESDIEAYLYKPDEIDLDSTFFNLEKNELQRFDNTKTNLKGKSGSKTETDNTTDSLTHLQKFTEKMEVVKKHIEKYEAKKLAEERENNSKILIEPGTSKLSDSDSEIEWEEVQNKRTEDDVSSRHNIEITLDMPDAIKNKKGSDLMAAIKRRINRIRRENQVLIHKVHLLCWIGHGNYVNSVINSTIILSLALSLLPPKENSFDKSSDLEYLEQIIKWYKINMDYQEQLLTNDDQRLEEKLVEQIATKKAAKKKDFVYIFIAILRALGIQCRLVLSFIVEPLRPPDGSICSMSTKNVKNKKVVEKLSKDEKNTFTCTFDGNLDKKPVVLQVDGVNDEIADKPNLKKLKQKSSESCALKHHPKRLKTTKFCTSPFVSPQANRINLRKLKIRQTSSNFFQKSRPVGCSSGTRRARKRKNSLKSESGDNRVKKRLYVKNSESFATVVEKGTDVWAEVFLESTAKWMSVDIIKGQIDCINEFYTAATSPLCYVIAWNNSNTLKDITSRYCKDFNSTTRKLRVDCKWWEATLKTFIGPKTIHDKAEDAELERLQLDYPLPTSIAEYKNHPLYVLQRHLLKYQAIYPPDTPPVGFVRGEAVYPRECVYVLHSRDVWIKHAKVVKLGETPFKSVKGRPRFDKLSNKAITGVTLQLFGIWQTQDYEPPIAENGVVPRNAFGNVELFKPEMLPKKTVHLKLPALNKTAQKMNIDCAFAVIGFDNHGGWNHPVFEGFVVCEEFADKLVAAWEKEQEEIKMKEREKIEKRVIANWKKVVKGLLIRERLSRKYKFGKIQEGSS